jgi:selenocysteine lyase/cysteine desulfurase
MLDRRGFLRVGGAVGLGAVTQRANGLEEIEAAAASVAHQTPQQVAQDEFFWREIQSAFALDRTISNLNNGNSCPSPRVVMDALRRYFEFSNQAPVRYRGQIEQNLETVRRRLAAEAGCELEELAITRNASEALQIAQNGIDLKPGDEVITTDQDYPRMLQTWDQLAKRNGIKVTRIGFPVPTTGDDLVRRFEAAITPRTRVLHFCHITNLTGQLFPVQRISRLARQRGLVSIVDGAHAFAHFPFKLSELECDYYGTSLHKWLLAPHGTGFLYVRRDRIASTWALQAPPAAQTNDIRKFEQIGTHPAGVRASIAEALAFHQAIGADRKAARLQYLTHRWADRLRANPRIQIHSSLAHDQTWGLALVGIEGIPAAQVSTFLWDRYRIIANAVTRDDYQGVRITPNVYTTLQEIDTFSEAMERILKEGVGTEA